MGLLALTGTVRINKEIKMLKIKWKGFFFFQTLKYKILQSKPYNFFIQHCLGHREY